MSRFNKEQTKSRTPIFPSMKKAAIFRMTQVTGNGAGGYVGVNGDHHSKTAKTELKSFKGPVKQEENASDGPVKPSKVTRKASPGQKWLVLAFPRELMINTSSGVTTFSKGNTGKVCLLSLRLTCVGNFWTIFWTFFQNKGRFRILQTQIYLE